MTKTPVPRGTVGDGPRGLEVRIERSFQLPIEEVWAAMTESDQLEQWVGKWEGDPATGRLTFWMTAEGDDVEPEQIVITQCEPPFRFAGDTSVGEDSWHLRFELNHEDGHSTVTFAQVIGDDSLASIGPGWEYYLDRLAAVLEGKNAAIVDSNDYYPSMREYYEALAH